jgi:hypothetical protein
VGRAASASPNTTLSFKGSHRGHRACAANASPASLLLLLLRLLLLLLLLLLPLASARAMLPAAALSAGRRSHKAVRSQARMRLRAASSPCAQPMNERA